MTPHEKALEAAIVAYNDETHTTAERHAGAIAQHYLTTLLDSPEMVDVVAGVINDVNGASLWRHVNALAQHDEYKVAKGIVRMRTKEAQAVISAIKKEAGI